MDKKDISFSEVEERILSRWSIYKDQFSIDINKGYALAKLIEEVGEVNSASLTIEGKVRPDKSLPLESAKDQLGEEISDVLGTLILLAKIYDIDLMKSLDKKWLNRA